jgi:hypothetical protein
MAQTAAQRQAAYRKRRPTAGKNGERRLNTWISTGAALALKRLAAYHGTVQRQILEQMLLDAEGEIMEALRGNEDELQRFLDGDSSAAQTNKNTGGKPCKPPQN